MNLLTDTSTTELYYIKLLAHNKIRQWLRTSLSKCVVGMLDRAETPGVRPGWQRCIEIVYKECCHVTKGMTRWSATYQNNLPAAPPRPDCSHSSQLYHQLATHTRTQTPITQLMRTSPFVTKRVFFQLRFFIYKNQTLLSAVLSRVMYAHFSTKFCKRTLRSVNNTENFN